MRHQFFVHTSTTLPVDGFRRVEASVCFFGNQVEAKDAAAKADTLALYTAIMSLNGLDDPKVAAAYETAAAEPGGW